VWVNPLAQLLQLSRGVLLHGDAPTTFAAGAVASLNVALIWISWRFFKTAEKRFAEYV
jgi:ABC-type polysaccharide/polyol phosphate export permease